jgi:hypothetical protein
MKLFVLTPGASGEAGPETQIIFNDSDIPHIAWEVVKLEYEFQGWLGDELLLSVPSYIVTESLADDMLSSDLSGFVFDKVLVSRSEDFWEFYPDFLLPNFRWLKPVGRVLCHEIGTSDDWPGNQIILLGTASDWSGHDVCLSQRSMLVVTERAMEVIQRHCIAECEIQEIELIQQ